MNVNLVRKISLETKNSPLYIAEKSLRRLLAGLEIKFEDDFITAILAARAFRTIKDYESIVENGDVDIIATDTVIEEIIIGSILFALLSGGNYSAADVTKDLGRSVFFSSLDPAIETIMSAHRTRITSNFRVGQLQASTEALLDGMRRGDSLRAKAQSLRNSIGLTTAQVKTVNKYRDSLEDLSKSALVSSMRDTSMDATLNSAIDSGKSLSPKQIKFMVGRYRTSQLRYRARTLAEAEVSRAIHEGNDEMFRQLVAGGDLTVNQIERTWRDKRDEKVRSSHYFMHNQVKGQNELFVSGAGNFLRFPHDARAPIGETIHCRCILIIKVNV